MLNKTFLILIIVFSVNSYYSFSQNIFLESFHNNIYYRGIDNPIVLHINNFDCDSIHITTDNGRIRKIQDCRYYYTPKSNGLSTLTIHQIKGNDTVEICKKDCRIKNLPKPTARIAGIEGGEISKNILLSQLGINLTHDNYELDFNIKVKSFKIIILRGNETVYIGTNYGNKFSNETKSGLSQIKPGYNVYFLNIIGIYPSGEETMTNSIEFFIR